MGKRSQHEPEKENNERWLLTYSDLITLLMIFFVIMYTISNVNSKKFAQLSTSMSQALVGQASGQFIGESPGPMMIEGKGAGAKEAAQMQDAEKQIKKYVKEQGLEGKVVVSEEERGLVISLKEALLFNIGSSEITPNARDVMLKVGQILNKMPNNIRIEGHTCNLPISTAQFPSNWELSTARATNVVRFLVTQGGVNAGRLSATGYGEFRPIVPNTTEPNRAKNRRVDMVVLKSALDVAEPGKQGSQKAPAVKINEPTNENAE